MDEITGGKGIIFATGTPVSNSMAELFTIQRYLRLSTLKRLGLQNFDSWASTFGETVTALELAPEGTGFRAKTRFARFFNLPELMGIFKEAADIKTGNQTESYRLARLAKTTPAIMREIDQMILYPTFVHFSHRRVGVQRNQILYNKNYKGRRV